MALDAWSNVKTSESIACIPSLFITVHVNVPQVVGYGRLLLLVAAESCQLKTPAAFLMWYVKAGKVKIEVSSVRVSV
jgi:hypothetical protein